MPIVLNANNPEWIFQRHVEGLMEYGSLVKWNEVATEGYIILNPEADAARLTGAKTNLDSEEIKAYGRLADQMLKLPIVYLEYSGVYGDPDIARQLKSVLNHARLFYGGGIRNAEQAQEMANWADTVVVGNVIYEDIGQALKTVAAVKGS